MVYNQSFIKLSTWTNPSNIQIDKIENIETNIACKYGCGQYRICV